MKTYFVNYALLGGGVLEIKAKNKDAAVLIAMDVSDEMLRKVSEFDGGFSIDYIEDEDGEIFYEDEDANIKLEDRIGFIVCT
jgi:hypothetical protein